MGSGHQSPRETEENLTRVRRLLGWTDAERRDNVRTGSLPHSNLQPGEFVLFVPYLYCGLGIPISSFFMLLLEAFGLQLQHLTPHSILHAAIFAHFCEMFVGVPPCVTLFRHFFSVRCSGRSSTEIGRYYFLLKGSGGRSTYLPTFASAKWEHWRNDWVIVRAEPNHRLALPDSSPDASLPEGASTDLPPEFSPVLARIAELAEARPLQMRPRLVWSYTGSNDCSRVVHGEDHDLTPLLLEEWVRCVTDVSFPPEQLRLPSAIVPLCRDQALRMAVLREMPTLHDGGLAARQLGGDPNRGVHIADAPVGGSGARGTAPADKGKGPVAASPVVPPAGGEETRRRLVRGDGTFVSEPDPKRQRTSGEGSSSGQGERVPPPPPGQRHPQRRAPPPTPDQPQRPSLVPPASGPRQQQPPAVPAADRQPRRGSGLRGRWSAPTLRPTRPAGVPPPSGSGGRATTAEKCAPGGPTAGDALRARATTEGPAPGATPSVRPQAPGGPTPGGASGVETAPRAPGSPMPEGVAAQGPAPGAAPDARTSEPSSPAAQTTSPGSPPPAEGELEEALDDAQEALQLEWARLQQEREGLDGWRARLGEQIEAATAQHTQTRAELSTARTELDADRAAFHEDLQRLIGRERAVGIREKQAEVGEARLKLEQAKLGSAWKGVEQRRQELVEVSERQAAVNAELDKMKLRLVEREAAVAAREDSVTQREASAKALRDSAARQAATLKVREDWVKSREAELADQERQLLAERAALEKLKQGAAQQAAVEDQEQMRAGLQHIADWAGEASSALVPLGLSPIRVTEPPSTIADAFPVLDSAVERLQRLDSTLGERLEAEGRELCRLVVEHLLVCFRSHDPAISLDPVIAGPEEEAEACRPRQRAGGGGGRCRPVPADPCRRGPGCTRGQEPPQRRRATAFAVLFVFLCM
ncbi:hypothetical protein BS78_01G273800 [Paspalum vaginatum]|nr:hypothetical protein BS78_01G273800 [Paspalum vaginatum]